MKVGVQTAMLATVTVLMCMVAVLTGFAFMKLSERDAVTPTYTVTDVSDDTGSIAFDGSVSFESFDESANESVFRFNFRISTDGHGTSGSVTVMIDNDTLEPFGFRSDGAGAWANDDGTVLQLSDSGEILSVMIVSDGLMITAHRNP